MILRLYGYIRLSPNEILYALVRFKCTGELSHVCVCSHVSITQYFGYKCLVGGQICATHFIFHISTLTTDHLTLTMDAYRNIFLQKLAEREQNSVQNKKRNYVQIEKKRIFKSRRRIDEEKLKKNKIVSFDPPSIPIFDFDECNTVIESAVFPLRFDAGKIDNLVEKTCENFCENEILDTVDVSVMTACEAAPTEDKNGAISDENHTVDVSVVTACEAKSINN